jgi:hypothetical protein
MSLNLITRARSAQSIQQSSTRNKARWIIASESGAARSLTTFLKTSDRAVLDKIFEIYKPIHEKVPTPDPKLMGVALKQLAATVPQTNQLKVEDFTDRSLIAELESEGFIAKVYDGR